MERLTKRSIIRIVAIILLIGAIALWKADIHRWAGFIAVLAILAGLLFLSSMSYFKK